MDNVNEKMAQLLFVVGKLIKAKGRYHTEQNYKALAEAYDAATTARNAAVRFDSNVQNLPSTASEVDERAAAAQVFTCKGKGGEYELVGWCNGAGTKRGECIVVYRDVTKPNVLFHRTVEDFRERMEWLGARAALASNPATTTEGAGDLPQRPEPAYEKMRVLSYGNVSVTCGYTADQMDAYGKACFLAGQATVSIPPEAWMRLGAMKEQARASSENIAELKSKYGLGDPDRAAKPADSEAK